MNELHFYNTPHLTQTPDLSSQDFQPTVKNRILVLSKQRAVGQKDILSILNTFEQRDSLPEAYAALSPNKQNQLKGFFGQAWMNLFLESRSQEKLDLKLISLSHCLTGQGNDRAALIILSDLSQQNLSLEQKSKLSSLSDRLAGGGSFLDQAQRVSQRFLSEAMNPLTIASFMAGAYAFKRVKLFSVTSAARRAPNFLTRGTGLRLLSNAQAFSAEVGVFTAMGMTPHLWNGQKFHAGMLWDSLKQNTMTLGVLKSMGYWGQAATAHIPSRMLQQTAGFSSGVLGLSVSHQLQAHLGWRSQETWKKSFFDAAVLQTQLSLGAALAKPLLGPRYAEHLKEVQMKTRYFEQISWGHHTPQLAFSLAGPASYSKAKESLKFSQSTVLERRMNGLVGERDWGVKTRATSPQGITPFTRKIAESRKIVQALASTVSLLNSRKSMGRDQVRSLRSMLRNLKGLLEELNDLSRTKSDKIKMLRELGGRQLSSAFELEDLIARRGERVNDLSGKIIPLAESLKKDIFEIQDHLLALGFTPSIKVLQKKNHSDEYLKRILRSQGITDHQMDLDSFRSGIEVGSLRKDYTQGTAWDVDEVVLHWGFGIRDLFRGRRGEDASYHHTTAAQFRYEAFQYDAASLAPLSRGLLAAMKVLPWRIRQHIQWSPGVMAYQLGLSLGAESTLTMCTTGPAGRIMILLNEHPALRKIYLGKSFYESVSIDEVRAAENIYTRESLVLAMRQALKLVKEKSSVGPLIQDYIAQVQANPKKGAKLKHPAIAQLLGKRKFYTLVDDSSATFKMLADNPHLVVFKVPSHRKTFFRGGSVQLNFTSSLFGRPVDAYLNRMVLGFTTSLANQMYNMSINSSRTSEYQVAADYPLQRMQVEIPLWRMAAEFNGPFSELKVLAKKIAQEK